MWRVVADQAFGWAQFTLFCMFFCNCSGIVKFVHWKDWFLDKVAVDLHPWLITNNHDFREEIHEHVFKANIVMVMN